MVVARIGWWKLEVFFLLTFGTDSLRHQDHFEP